jgi:LCP family protein required for cell wall assembly
MINFIAFFIYLIGEYMKRRILLFVCVVSFLIGLFSFKNSIKVNASTNNSQNFLVVGLDKDQNISRSDVIILANLNNKTNHINLISIPRDSLVSIPCGSKGTVNDKVNHSYVYGEVNWGENKGIDCLVQTISRLFEIPLVPYVIFDFESVKKTIDIMGGILFTPKMSFKAKDSLGRVHNFQKGKEMLLDGEASLAFMRHRASLTNQDLDRCNNQKDLFMEVVNKINGFTRLDKIKYGIRLYSLIKTNIKYDEIFLLVKIDIGSYEKKTYTLKGKSIYDKGYYYVLDKEYLKQIKKIL